MARILDSLPIPGGIPPEVELTVRGWISFVDAVSVRWLAERTLPQERVRDLLTDLFVSLIGAAATSAAGPNGG